MSNLYIVVGKTGDEEIHGTPVAVSGRWFTGRSEQIWIDYHGRDAAVGPAGVAVMTARDADKVAEMVGGTPVLWERGD